MGKIRAIPEYIVEEIEFENDEGEVEILKFKFFVKGPGCPMPIVLETDQLTEDYYDSLPVDSREALGPDAWNALSLPEKIEYNKQSTKRINKNRRAELVFRRDLLRAISRPELPVEIANILSSEESEGYKLLVKTKWYNDYVPEAEVEEKGNVEWVDGGELTSPTLVPSTQE